MTVKLSVVVPCYNEQSRFKEGFNHLYLYLKNQKYRWEIIFVNDGSKDSTSKLMQEMSKNRPNIKIVSYEKNKGKGYAIIQGVKKAKGSYILFTDIDHSVPIATVESFFKLFNIGYKVVIGSRRVEGANIKVHQKPLREFLGRGFTFFVNVMVCWGVTDVTCGFKAFEGKIAKEVFKLVSIYDWAFDAEIIFICKKNKIKFAQAPVIWSDNRATRVSLKRDVLRSALGIFKIRLNDILDKYQL